MLHQQRMEHIDLVHLLLQYLMNNVNTHAVPVKASQPAWALREMRCAAKVKQGQDYHQTHNLVCRSFVQQAMLQGKQNQSQEKDDRQAFAILMVVLQLHGTYQHSYQVKGEIMQETLHRQES